MRACPNWIRHLTRNQKTPGSNPGTGTLLSSSPSGRSRLPFSYQPPERAQTRRMQQYAQGKAHCPAPPIPAIVPGFFQHVREPMGIAGVGGNLDGRSDTERQPTADLSGQTQGGNIVPVQVVRLG